MLPYVPQLLYYEYLVIYYVDGVAVTFGEWYFN